jgi:hypothetical protein
LVAKLLFLVSVLRHLRVAVVVGEQARSIPLLVWVGGRCNDCAYSPARETAFLKTMSSGDIVSITRHTTQNKRDSALILVGVVNVLDSIK